MKSIVALLFAALVVGANPPTPGEFPWQTGAVIHVPPGPHA